MTYVAGFVHRLRRTIARSILHPLAKNTALLASSQYLSAVIRLGTTVWAARLLTPEEYGAAALVMVYPALVASVVGLKSQTVAIKYLALFRARNNRSQLLGVCKLAYSVDFVLSVAIAVIVSVTAEWVSVHFYDLPGLSWLIIVYAGSFPLVSLGGTSAAILNSHQEFRTLAFFYLLQPVISLLCVGVLLSLGFGVAGMVLGLTIGPVANALAMNFAATRVLYRDGSGFWWRGTLASVKHLRHEFCKVSGWNYLREGMRGVLEAAPSMLLAHYRPVQEVGFYRLADSLVSVARYLEGSMGRVVYPMLAARLDGAHPGAVAGILRKFTVWGGGPMAAVPLLVVFVIPSFVPLVFGSRYDPMVVGAQLLMVGAAFEILFFWVIPAYFANNELGVYTRCSIPYVGVMLVGFWFAVEGWGFIGLTGIQSLGRVVFVSIMAMSMLRSLR